MYHVYGSVLAIIDHRYDTELQSADAGLLINGGSLHDPRFVTPSLVGVQK